MEIIAAGVVLFGIHLPVLGAGLYLEWKRKEPVYMLVVKWSMLLGGIGTALCLYGAYFGL